MLLAYIKDAFRVSTDFSEDNFYNVLLTPSFSTPEESNKTLLQYYKINTAEVRKLFEPVQII